MFLFGLFGQRFVGSLPPHQYTTAAQYYFEVVQRLEMNGYLLANEMGKRLFQEWATERPGRAAEISALATAINAGLTSGTGPDAQQASAPIAPPTLTATKDSSPLQLTLRIISGHVEATWLSEGKPQRGEDALPTELPEVDAAQARVWSLTKAGTAEELAKAVDALGHTLTQALIRPNIQEQLGKARDAATRLNRPFELRLDFANSEKHAHYSWELLREPSPPHRVLSTLPGVFITRPFTFAALPTPPDPGEKKLLLVLGEERGRRELDAVKALWEAKGHQVTVLEFTAEEQLQLTLFSAVWDVVHFITHGDREKVFLGVPTGQGPGETLDAEQLGNLMQGNVRTACLLSVCNSGLRTLPEGEVPGALLWRGVAQQIIGAGAPNVLGWSNLAYIDDCRRATPIWHQAYLNGEDPRAATQKARRVLVGVKERSYGWLVHFTA
jgi:hypothetical protein